MRKWGGKLGRHKKKEFKSIFYASHSLVERQIKQKEKCIAKRKSLLLGIRKSDKDEGSL